MDVQKSQEELLREAACIGDIVAVHTLLSQGVNPNSQNPVNGWTALHWASKRGHHQIAQALLSCGADPTLVSIKGETAASVTTDISLVEKLGRVYVSENTAPPKKEDSFIPHYITHPPLNPKIGNIPITKLSPERQTSVTMNKSLTNSCTHAEETSKELVLKVRVANITDPDFIEVEIPELTFSCLLRVCCDELGIAAQRVTRVRKLPNTILRKDRDVQRLQYLQEIEMVMESASLFGSNGELPMNKSNATNSYQSISKYKNQTILY